MYPKLNDMAKSKHYTGSDLGQDFRTFYTKETNRIKKVLTEMGCTNIEFSRQFYYFSGFFTAPSGQVYYMSCSDVRHFPYEKLLYRTAATYKDYTGGHNCYVKPDGIKFINFN